MEQTQTLIQVISLVAGLYSVAWGFIGWPMKITPAAALRFGIANLLVMVGVWLTLRRQVESTYLAYQVADVVLMIGFTCFRAGVQFLTGAKYTLRENIAVVALVAVADFAVGPSRENIVAEAFVFSVGVAWITSRSFWETYQSLGRDFSPWIRLFLALPFGVCGMVLMARALVLVAVPSLALKVADIFNDTAVVFLWSQLVLLLMANLTVGAIAIGGLFLKIRAMAERDGLTGVWNRRAIEGRTDTELERFRRSGAVCALAMLDLDHFKTINDRLGHDGGDAALKHVCQVVQSSLRKMDSLGRFGGEEFIVLLPNTDLVQARVSMERIRSTLVANPLVWKGTAVPITTSIGLAGLCAGDGIVTVVKRADEALYRAKANGRNRVETQVAGGAQGQ
jgi:diguanylate cyclase (GGDEF)-like protein